MVKVKVQFTIEKATNAQRGSTDIAVLFLIPPLYYITHCFNIYHPRITRIIFHIKLIKGKGKFHPITGHEQPEGE